MKKRLIIFSILLTSILAIEDIYSQKMSINPLSAIEQFPSRSVQRILQDSDGYLWFGTLDGLCRYDGYRVQTFRSDMNNPNLLTNNEITCLVEDKNHNIWIGTKEGVNILNRNTFEIRHIRVDYIQSGIIRCILAASDGAIWIGTGNTVYRYNLEEGKIENMSERGIPSAGINSIYEDKYGDIWVSLWNWGLHRYKKDGTVVSYPKIGHKNNPFKIFHDNKNQYWICTWGDGLYQFFPNNNPEKMYLKFDVYNDEGSRTEDTFYSIVQDDSFGYIWAISFSGLYALEYASDNTIRQVHISHLLKNTNNIFSELIKDQDGSLWIAAFSEGAFSVNFNKPDIQNIDFEDLKFKMKTTPNITLMYKDHEGVLWLNQNRFGLCLYYPESKSINRFTDFHVLKNIQGMKNITCIRQMNVSNDVWIGFTNEPVVYVLDRNKQNIVVKSVIDLREKQSKAEGVRLFFEDSKNNIWIITSSEVFFKPYNSDEIHLLSDISSITAITEDIQGAIWMSSEGGGVYKIESVNIDKISEQKIDNYNKKSGDLISDNITTICAAQDGYIWMGTREGSIIVYNHKNQKFEDYTQSCRMTGEAIQDIIVDKFNNIWITTNKKIIEYNPISGASRDYSVSDGLLVNSFLKGSVYIDNSKNQIYFGGNQGISILNPTKEWANMDKRPRVQVSDVKLQGQSLINNNTEPKFSAMLQELILDSDDKNIEIDFTSLDYIYPKKIIYAYKMDGIDDNWIYTDGSRQFATYNNLKKGTNIFYIKATDENRLWSGDVTVFKIYKQPAFYETWWAYILYVLFIMTCLYITFRIVRNRIRLRNQLKIAQIEKDKSEELVQTKLRYFTNISHDFLTPLTIVSCLIDDIETMSDRKISQFEVMRANINRLRRLLQQVLDFRKVESGNMKLKVSNGDISAFIEDICLNNFIPLINKKKINFIFESEPKQIQGYFDADKLDKIVYNILSNALKYTPAEGNVKVAINTYVKGNFSFLQIEISDTGLGIHPDDINSIFTRFYFNKKNNTAETNGIGLSLTRDLVTLHHGTISVESELNVGTTFKVGIPIDENFFSEAEISNTLPDILNVSECLDDAEINEEINTTKEVDSQETEEINILLVEDNEDILYTLKNILQKHYNIFTATNGLIALNIVKDNDIDIIVSDIMMPEMDGLELCRTLKSSIETSHISILLLTAKNSVEDRIECYEAGADGYISKPFDMKVLVARINSLVVNKKSRQSQFKSNVEINIATLDYPSLDEQFLNNAVKIIEDHLSDTGFDINIFAKSMNMSKSSLYRKIRTMTSLPPNEFIRNIRLKHACLLLKDKSRTISEIAYSVGFTDPRYFATCFKSEFGMTPSEYQKSI